ncbi:MAG: hypothetical protein KAH33_05685, partial [Candidatus Delongbacteria bacterium]|nr:hypothetical protein [Candidatus Delongbacteria bacterium]
DEIITGWVRKEDVGAKDFYSAKYDRAIAEYQREYNSIGTKIIENETYLVELRKDLENQQDTLQTLAYKKTAFTNILTRSVSRRKNYLLDEKKEAEEIEDGILNIRNKVVALRSKNTSINKELNKSKNLLFELNAENTAMSNKLKQLKGELPLIMPKLKKAYEQKKIAEKDKKVVTKVKKIVKKVQETKKQQPKITKKQPKDSTSDKCLEFEKLHKSKLDEFNKVKSAMSKPGVSKTEYNKLYESYTDLWNEASHYKRKLKECKFSQNSKHKALYNEAIGLKKEEEYDDALGLLFEAIEIKSDFEEAYFQIVLILIELDEDSEIDEYLTKVTNPEKKGKLLHRRANSIKNNYPKKAIKYYKEMAKYYKPALAYYQIGLIYSEKLSAQNSAVKYFKKSLKKNSKDPKVYEAVGAAILETKPPKGKSKKTITDQAISYFEKGIKYGKGYKNIHVLCARLAQVYNELGKSTSALKYADMAIKKAPNKKIATGFLEKGIALTKMNKKKEAEKYLNRAKKYIMTKEQAIFWLKELKK